MPETETIVEISRNEEVMTSDLEKDASGATEMDKEKPVVNSKDAKTTKKSANKKVKEDVQAKIMAYFGQELQADREDLPKQEVAEACGYTKAGSHNFFYSWQDLERNKKWIAKSKSGKNLFFLTDLGKDNIPRGMVLVSKKQDNAGKQKFFLEMLLKQCKEANKKAALLFEIMADGEAHSLEEFTKATGYANLKSKGLGYPLTHMIKKMKIVEKTEDNKYRFTDKCFPEGRT